MEQRPWSDALRAVPALQDGDLAVARKAGSALDKLIELTDDPFHHIGIVVERTIDDQTEPWVIEHTFAGCTARKLSVFVDHYDDVGFVYLDLPPEERAHLRHTALGYLGTTPRYAWDEVFLVGMCALARKTRGTKHSLSRRRWLTSLEAAIHRRNSSERRAVFCTTFVMQLFADANIATPKHLGLLAPPRSCTTQRLRASKHDKMMRRPLPVQMLAGVGSLMVLLCSATTLMLSLTFTGRPAASPPLLSPSDFWRHMPAQHRWARQNNTGPTPEERTSTQVLLGRSKQREIAA